MWRGSHLVVARLFELDLQTIHNIYHYGRIGIGSLIGLTSPWPVDMKRALRALSSKSTQEQASRRQSRLACQKRR